MKEVSYTIDIDASASKVWDTLWQDKTFRDWAGLVDPGTYMVGELNEGSEVEFISSENGYGVTSRVEKVIPGQYLLLRHRADTQDSGARQRDEQWTGGKECYELTEHDGVTTLKISFDVPLELETEFETSYPKALERVKVLSEQHI